MLKSWTRVFLDKDGSITDKSIASQDGNGFSCDLTTSEYLYIGQYFPFNNFSVDMLTANVSAGSLDIEYWDGSAFENVVDILDGSVSGGITLGKNGTIQFQPDKNNSWSCISDTSDESDFPLSGSSVYDLYWLRIKPSSNIGASCSLKYLRYKFCEHADLIKEDPEINEYLAAWGGPTKTSWDEQIYVATDNIISDLRGRKLIMHPGQILRFEDVHKACVYQTLVVIYSQLGDSFKGKVDTYIKHYKSHLGDKRFTFDVNLNASVDVGEQNLTVGMGVR
jgi:hypothetical protein